MSLVLLGIGFALFVVILLVLGVYSAVGYFLLVLVIMAIARYVFTTRVPRNPK